MTVETPEDADHIMDTINMVADPCATLRELLDIMSQNPQLFAAQIARACAMLKDLNCPPHPLCGEPT